MAFCCELTGERGNHKGLPLHDLTYQIDTGAISVAADDWIAANMRSDMTNLNDSQSKPEGFFPELEHDSASSFRDALRILDGKSDSAALKGTYFEYLVKAFIETDKAQSERFDMVWRWPDWPHNENTHDTGIDLVARERDSGDFVAIQCKFYAETAYISKAHVDTFLATMGKSWNGSSFGSGIFVSTTSNWTSTASNSLQNWQKPVARWGPEKFEQSSIDWSEFSLSSPNALGRKAVKELREYQQNALEDVARGFREHDRGKLIMACGSGKTFTALRIAEETAGKGGTVLFLTPSISLLAQSLADWTGDAELPMKAIPVCSDTRVAGGQSADYEDISPWDMSEPASTDADTLVKRFNAVDRSKAMTAVFSTYQSLDVVAAAQGAGLPEFDLIVCDEAHRTTGASLVGESESNFRRVHDNGFIAGAKRLYMTATPRIYGDGARQRANQNRVTLASMDDESLYGPEFHRLGFGKAIEMKILSDYKVMIFDVDMKEAGVDLDELLSDGDTEVNMDNGTRMVGCWNGLRKHTQMDFDFFKSDPAPAKRAVAFSNTIAQSKLFEEWFPTVVEKCIGADGDPNLLRCEVKHVDGGHNALERAAKLDWLNDEPEDNVCKVLSNARCLTEGIDVPALDAILFMEPRRSEIDVVQTVGRVMRKSPGKEHGYIILPIARAPGASAQETVSESAYRAVWQVINAIAAHDDRFEAKINQLNLEKGSGSGGLRKYTGGDDIGKNGNEKPDEYQLPFIFDGQEELRDAILARLVDRYSNPRYWEEWADRVRAIAKRHEARIRALLSVPDSGVRPTFNDFLKGLHGILNDDITEDDAIGMLSQHLVSKPVFDALFDDYDFVGKNPVSKAMQGMIDALAERGLEKETLGLEDFYRDVRIRAEGVKAEGRQKIIAELYERFFKQALPEDVFKSLGIAYTPVEVVDYIIRSVEDVLNKDFGASIGDEGVHVIDPFVGTGTFITRLLQSGIISAEDMPRKYKHEIHANDIHLLAYYIAAVNIESAYHEIAEPDEYEPFEGIALADTFQAHESNPPMFDDWFPENNERIKRQKDLNIRVVIGNPPWSANNNRAYPAIDSRVRESYAKLSAKINTKALQDPYVKGVRLLSDVIQKRNNGGIVAFVLNGGFVESNAFDGFRKTIAAEFDSIYCYNLRGDQRTAGDISRREGGKIFGSLSRAGVAILLLVQSPRATNRHGRPIATGDQSPRATNRHGRPIATGDQSPRATNRQYLLP